MSVEYDDTERAQLADEKIRTSSTGSAEGGLSLTGQPVRVPALLKPLATDPPEATFVLHFADPGEPPFRYSDAGGGSGINLCDLPLDAGGMTGAGADDAACSDYEYTGVDPASRACCLGGRDG